MQSFMRDTMMRDIQHRKQHNDYMNRVRSGNRNSSGVGFGLNLFSGNIFGLNISANIDLNSVIYSLPIFNNQKTTSIKEVSNCDMNELKKHFDFKLCRLLYDDYVGMTDEQIMEHYATYGHNEKRVVYFSCEWFDPKVYKYLSDDLSHMTDDEA
jgi:hypothetical protein